MLTAYFITNSLKIYEKIICLEGLFFGLSKPPKDREDLNKKITHVEKRIEVAFRRFLYLQPLSWQRDAGITPDALGGKEIARLTRNCHISSFMLCYGTIIVRLLDPEAVLTDDQKLSVDRWGPVISKNFRDYLTESLTLYRTPFTN